MSLYLSQSLKQTGYGDAIYWMLETAFHSTLSPASPIPAEFLRL